MSQKELELKAREFYRQRCSLGNPRDRFSAEQVIEMLAAFTESHSRQLWLEAPWISVSERLPESDRENVLICLNSGQVSVGFYGESGWWLLDSDRAVKVTHWMPLPKPPKAESTLPREEK